MKRFTLLAAFTAMAFMAQAQWKIGPKAYFGVVAQAPGHFSIMPMQDNRLYDIRYIGSSFVTSAGFMMYNDVGPIFLQAELMGSAYRNEFLMSGYKNLSDATQLMQESYLILEIPVNAGIKIDDFKLGLGPVMEFLLDADSDWSRLSDYRNRIRPMDFSFQFMAGYNIGVLHIDIKYINKFSSLAESFQLGEDIMKYNRSANRLMLGLGLAF
jgi:hypothetical protein